MQEVKKAIKYAEVNVSILMQWVSLFADQVNKTHNPPVALCITFIESPYTCY
jgi:hypothetical protein